jgi:TetR/AcrR family transcriptional repressor of lmrAB and yxaGH operons
MTDPAASTPPARRAQARGASSRSAFVHTAGRLLRRQGYAATGLNEIVTASGAPRGSLYFHFPGGKEQLAITAMEQVGEQLARAIEAILASSDELPQSLARLVDALAAGLEASDYADGCPIATVALEASAASEPIRLAASAAFASWIAVLRARLVEEGFGDAAAQRRALLVLAAIEGALILARAERDLAPLHAVRDELLALRD